MIELTDEQLEMVIGGASIEFFNKWKSDIVNKHLASDISNDCNDYTLFHNRSKHRACLQRHTNKPIQG